jgi:hypothetical protein
MSSGYTVRFRSLPNASELRKFKTDVISISDCFLFICFMKLKFHLKVMNDYYVGLL